MRSFVRTIVTGAALASIVLAPPARAQEQDRAQPADLEKKVQDLAKQVESLKQQAKKADEKAITRWLTIGGDYRFRIDHLRGEVPDYFQFTGAAAPPVAAPGFDPKNDTLFTNRFGLNIKAKATKDVTVSSRLLMYKTAGRADAGAVNAGFFADRSFLLDGTLGHVPADNTLRVDQVYATWNNIAGQPIWFSVGRRPSTGGSPSHLRQNSESLGSGGVPALLVDYAFDGMTLGWAPEVGLLPGAYAKVCYGRGFEAGYDDTARGRNGLSDTDMVGIQVVPVETDPIRVDLQWNRGFNIFDNPNAPGAQLGDIDWFGAGLLSRLKAIGPGELHAFLNGGVSVTHPNGAQAQLPPELGGGPSGAGLLTSGAEVKDRTGWAAFAGVRYDFASATKLGFEFNHGSKYWIPFDPAADDLWTAKLGTRGNAYEVYAIQELPLAPLSSFVSKAFFKVGWQYYDFEYTGSNNWVGAPVRIAELTASPFNAQMLAPLESAQNFYGTFEVRF